MTTIIGVQIENRVQSAVPVQNVLTEFGCSIRTRIGLHKEIDGQCSPGGIVLLEITNDEEATEVVKKLCDIDGIEIQQMKF